MKPTLIFTGTVSRAAERETPDNGKPYVAFTLESPDAFNKFPNRLRCMCYGKRADDALGSAAKGAVVSVVGSAAARGYTGKDGSAKAVLCCYVNEFDVISAAPQDGQHAEDADDARRAFARQPESAATPQEARTEDRLPF